MSSLHEYVFHTKVFRVSGDYMIGAEMKQLY